MKPYNDYNSYLKSKYGQKVYRIGLDAGFSCPNRDGTKGAHGCLYCNDAGSRATYADPRLSIVDQLRARMDHLKKVKGAGKFIAYFQAFTNTYAPCDKLKEIYDSVLPYDEIVGISVGTRPDTVDRDTMALLASYMPRREVWIEFGLQSSHNRTLEAIKRGHTFEDFASAATMAREFGIKVCTHVILGLPGETRSDMLETADRLAGLKIDGVKIHLLHVLKGSELQALYRDGKVTVLGQDEYVALACDFLEHLPQAVIIQRLTGQGSVDTHLAPAWALDKLGTIGKIEEEFARRGTGQGTAVRS